MFPPIAVIQACIQDLSSLTRAVAGSDSNPTQEQRMSNKVIEATSLILARAMCDPDGMVKNHDFNAADQRHESHNPPVPYNHAIMVRIVLVQSEGLV